MPKEIINTVHRPEGVISGPEPMCMAGLKLEDNVFLFGLHLCDKNEQRKIFAKKRAEYASDPVALQQIDVYDGDSVYRGKLRELMHAIMSENWKKKSELDAWFKEYYPDI